MQTSSWILGAVLWLGNDKGQETRVSKDDGKKETEEFKVPQKTPSHPNPKIMPLL